MVEADVIEWGFSACPELVEVADYPIKKMIAPSEVADMVAFLCGLSAATMSGSPIIMDTGSTVN